MYHSIQNCILHVSTVSRHVHCFWHYMAVIEVSSFFCSTGCFSSIQLSVSDNKSTSMLLKFQRMCGNGLNLRFLV
jgi:hypothetical protein